MKPLLTLSLLLMVGFGAGCANTTVEITSAQMKCYGTNPAEHTTYIGTDNTYHYFRWNHGLKSGEWKVKKEEIVLPTTFPFGEKKRRFVTRDNTGKITLVELNKTTK